MGVGIIVGPAVDMGVGITVGPAVGMGVGITVGPAVGMGVGITVGPAVDTGMGVTVGVVVGEGSILSVVVAVVAAFPDARVARSEPGESVGASEPQAASRTRRVNASEVKMGTIAKAFGISPLPDFDYSRACP